MSGGSDLYYQPQECQKPDYEGRERDEILEELVKVYIETKLQ